MQVKCALLFPSSFHPDEEPKERQFDRISRPSSPPIVSTGPSEPFGLTLSFHIIASNFSWPRQVTRFVQRFHAIPVAWAIRAHPKSAAEEKHPAWHQVHRRTGFYVMEDIPVWDVPTTLNTARISRIGVPVAHPGPDNGISV